MKLTLYFGYEIHYSGTSIITDTLRLNIVACNTEVLFLRANKVLTLLRKTCWDQNSLSLAQRPP